MFSRKLTRFVAAGAAAVAVAVGGLAIGNSSSGNGASGTTNAAPGGRTGPGGPIRPGPAELASRDGNAHHGSGSRQGQGRCGCQVPGGTVNRVLKLSDGSYAVHRIPTPAPHHVFVSKDFKVTGTA